MEGVIPSGAAFLAKRGISREIRPRPARDPLYVETAKPPLLILRSSRWRSRVAGASNRVARKHQFHAPVLLTAFCRIVGGNRFALAKPPILNRAGRNPLLHKVVADRLSPVLRQFLIIFVASDTVGVSFHSDMQ